MSDESDGSQKKNKAEEQAGEGIKSGKAAPVEPSETGLASGVKINQQENTAVKSRKGDEQVSISEQAFVDRIRRSDRWMIFLTAAIAAGGAVSAFIFGWQLHEMKVAAGLTRDSIKISRQTMISGQRAFVFVDSYEWQPSGDGSGWGISVYVENGGNTPARNLSIDLSCPQGTEVVDDPLNSPKLHGPTVHLKRVLGPKRKSTGGTCIFEMSAMRDFQKKGWLLYLVLQAHYEDMFGGTYTTEFCEIIFGLAGDLRTSKTLSTASAPCRTHNCADEECNKNKEDSEARPQ